MPAKKRCQFQSETRCNSAALRLVGQCPHCRAEFCGTVRNHLLSRKPPPLTRPRLALQHRMPEHHNCQNLESCRQQAFERNKLKLESERTVAAKMAMA